MNKSDVSALPHSTEMQQAVLGYLITDHNFFQRHIGKIQPEWFSDVENKVIFTEMLRFYKEYRERVKSSVELISMFAGYDLIEKRRYEAIIELAIKTRVDQFTVEYLDSQMNAWFMSIEMKKILYNASKLYNENQLIEAAQQTIDSFDRINRMVHKSDRRVVLSDPASLFVDQTEKLFARSCTMGLYELDRAINRDIGEIRIENNKPAWTGALIPGESTLIVAPTNIGKSTVLMTVIAHNLKKCKKVLWVTHEDTELNLSKKIWKTMLETPEMHLRQTFKDKDFDPDLRKRVSAFASLIDSHLTFIHIPSSMDYYVEDLMAEIKSLNADLRSKSSDGQGFDMIVDDYPGLLQLRNTRKDTQLRHVLSGIYGQFVKLASEESCHVLMAMQTNREANKNNKTGTKMLSHTDVSESHEVIHRLHNVITLNRSDKNQREGRLIFSFAKNRSGPVNTTISCVTRFDLGVAYSPNFGPKPCFEIDMDLWEKGWEKVGSQDKEYKALIEDKSINKNSHQDAEEVRQTVAAVLGDDAAHGIRMSIKEAFSRDGTDSLETIKAKREAQKYYESVKPDILKEMVAERLKKEESNE